MRDFSQKEQSDVVLIGDQRITKVPVIECEDELVDLIRSFPALAFDLDRLHVQKESASISFARRTVGEMLLKAQALLPTGINLLVKECHRPMFVQRGFWDDYSAYLRRKNPSWTETQLYDECSKFNAPLDVAPHTTGGAVDLTLADREGKWLDMGTDFNASPHDSESATYTHSLTISAEARANRSILVKAMSSVGFVNYPTEWWHWSYGDKYWAFIKGLPNAIYDSVELNSAGWT